MAFLKSEGVNLLSIVFASGSNNAIVMRSNDVPNLTLLFSSIHHHLHHK